MMDSMASGAERLKAVRERYDESMKSIASESGAVGLMAEAMDRVVQDLLRFEDSGWIELGALDYANQKGLSLKNAKEVTKYLEEQTKLMGGLLGRGLRLKNNHIFGKGYRFEKVDGSKIEPRFQKVIDDPDNWDTVFSPSAMKELNRILFTSGNLFVIYDEKEKLFDRLSIDLNVQEAISYQENKSRLKYVLRSYTEQNDIGGGGEKVVKEWIPTLSYKTRLKAKKTALPKTLKAPGETNGVKVRQDAVIIEKRVNKDNGDVWGVADAFSAAPYAALYASYLRDGAKLQNALAAISFLVKVKTETAARSAGAKISNARVGDAAIVGPNTEIQSMPRAGSIDLYEGRPIQAQVAAALDVSVTGLASDPGIGGSYASENALSQPEQLAALSRQEDLSDFFSQLFRAMGLTDGTINFHRLDSDPVHRQMQSIGLARVLGGIDQAEYRTRSLELLDIEAQSSEMPEPDEFTGSKASTLADALDANSDAVAQGNPIASQGNSGAVGALDDDGNNDAANSDRDAGTN